MSVYRTIGPLVINSIPFLVYHSENLRCLPIFFQSDFAKTPIADIFAGMIRSVVYKASAKETATLQPFFTLQLDIQVLVLQKKNHLIRVT